MSENEDLFNVGWWVTNDSEAARGGGGASEGGYSRRKCGHAKIAHLYINSLAYVKHLKTLQFLEYNQLKLNLNFEDYQNSIY